MNRVPLQSINSVVRRETDRRTLVQLGAVFVCGLLLTIGFVHAAAQHTAALREGYRSEELRRERDRLLAEQGRLKLALDEAQAPQHLEARARDIGLAPARSSQLDLSRLKAPGADAAKNTPIVAATIR